MRFDIFKNTNVFITGATGGLGREICALLVRYGCNLFMTSTSEDKLIHLKNSLLNNNEDSEIYFGTGRLENTEDVFNLCEQVKQKFDNKIDIIINCAGIFPLQSLSDTALHDYERCMNINVRAPFLFSQQLTHGMRQRKWGRIVNIGSSSSYNGSPDAGIYCISKHALLGLSRSLFQELKKDNVRVYSYSPGSIRTEMGSTDKRQDYSTFLDPQEVAEYILFMMSYNSELISEEVRVNRMVVQ